MGKSAKLHKRVKKTTKSSNAHSTPSSTTTGTSTHTHVKAAAKKASLKDKRPSAGKAGAEGPVLGGADYVSLLMGGRRKAREEAAKLPVSKD